MVVDNNLLSNKYGIDNLNKEGLALYEKIKAAGIGSIDEIQKKFVACGGNGDCERDARNEYRDLEKSAGQKLVSLYQSGTLSKDEFTYLLTDYSDAMLAGVQKGEQGSDWGGMLGDIYTQSGISWTPAGVISNPYIAAIKNSEQLSEWKSQGLSDEKIRELTLKNNIIDSGIAPVDVNGITNVLDNGASSDDIIKFAAGMAFNKVIQNTQDIKTGGAGSLTRDGLQEDTEAVKGSTAATIDADNSVAKGTDLVAPKITIQDHYNHHMDMVNDVKGQLASQGYRVNDREISFGSSCGVGRCRPDIVAEAPDGSLRIIEVKTGNADLSIRQSEIYPQINSGNSIPRGQVARDFGLRPNIALKDQGYPNGVPIEIMNFPGAKQ